MRERVGSLVGPVVEEDVGVDVPLGVRAHPARATATRSATRRQFTIYDQADAVRLTGYVIRDLGLDPKRFTARGVHAAISAAKNDLVSAPTRHATGRRTSSSARSPTSTPSTRPAS